jgi:hypothetical protein
MKKLKSLFFPTILALAFGLMLSCAKSSEDNINDGVANTNEILEDPRLSRNNVRVPRRDNYQNRPVLSATIHPDIKRTLVAMSERTGMSISQVTDEVLYTGLVEMQEL